MKNILKNPFTRFFITTSSAVILFILQFVVAPAAKPDWFPLSSEAMWILMLPLLLLSITWVFVIKASFIHVLISDVIYGVFVFFYNNVGLYDIGVRGTVHEYSTYVAIIETTVVVAAFLWIQTGFLAWRATVPLIKEHT